jgi:carbon monoxide dehydrogenase subunit G
VSLRIDIDLGYEFTVKAGVKAVFDLLSDVPASASHFPMVDRLVDLGDGVYRWEMKKLGTPQVHIQAVYASRYASNRRKGLVEWTPVTGVGNAQIAGRWVMAKAQAQAQAKAQAGTRCELHVQGVVELPLPPLMRLVVEPVVQVEFERLVEQYIDNLIQRFGGEV